MNRGGQGQHDACQGVATEAGSVQRLVEEVDGNVKRLVAGGLLQMAICRGIDPSASGDQPGLNPAAGDSEYANRT